MKAIRIQSHGGLEVLRVTTLPDPEPGTGEVVVRIKASAVNPLDGIIRMGNFPIAKTPPLILGEEAAGVVEGNEAGFKRGERVIVYGGGLGVFRDGTWAEGVAVPASSLRRLPEGVSFEEGAALSNVGVTALGALRTAELKAGETLVVLGATGGVGSAGVQIGKAIGARVIAVASTAGKGARLQALGASNPDILAHFTYVHPEVKPVTPEDKAAFTALLARQYALVVIDGVTNALAVFGYKTNENDDLAAFGKKFVEQIIRRTGAAIALIDHVVKDKTSQGRFAIERRPP